MSEATSTAQCGTVLFCQSDLLYSSFKLAEGKYALKPTLFLSVSMLDVLIADLIILFQ